MLKACIAIGALFLIIIVAGAIALGAYDLIFGAMIVCSGLYLLDRGMKWLKQRRNP